MAVIGLVAKPSLQVNVRAPRHLDIVCVPTCCQSCLSDSVVVSSAVDCMCSGGQAVDAGAQEQQTGSSSASSRPISTAQQTLEQAASAKFQLSQCGYVPGAIVRKRKHDDEIQGTPQLYRVLYVDDHGTQINPTGIFADTPGILMSLDKLKENWIPTNTKCQEKVDFTRLVPERNIEWKIMSIKSQIAMALHGLSSHFSEADVYDKLELYENPTAARIKQKCDKLSLVLVPTTRNIVCKPGKWQGKGIDLGVLISDPPHSFGLVGSPIEGKGDKAMVSPFWYVPDVVEGVEANMQSINFTVQLHVGCEKVGFMHDITINIPVIRNMKVVKPGDLLLLPATTKPAESAQKKAKA